MDRPTLFISTPVPPDLLADLAEVFQVIDVPPGTRDGLAEHGSPVGWLTDVSTPIDAQALSQVPDLRVVANFGVGYDNFDLAAIAAAGVTATNTPAVLNEAVAELGLGLILALGRRIVGLDAYTRDGRWVADGATHAPLTHDVHGQTLGIIGMGRIGSLLAELVRPLRMEVIYHDRFHNDTVEAAGLATWVEQEELLRAADFVVLLVPLTDDTRGLISSAELALMRSTAYLINIARGPIVDGAALADAVRRGVIAGAALDVFEVEPLPLDHALLDLDDVIVLPHVGSATKETRRRMIELAVRNVHAGALGEEVETPIQAP